MALLLLLLLLLNRSIRTDLDFIRRHVNSFFPHSVMTTTAGNNHICVMGIHITSSVQQLLGLVVGTKALGCAKYTRALPI